MKTNCDINSMQKSHLYINGFPSHFRKIKDVQRRISLTIDYWQCFLKSNKHVKQDSLVKELLCICNSTSTSCKHEIFALEDICQCVKCSEIFFRTYEVPPTDINPRG